MAVLHLKVIKKKTKKAKKQNKIFLKSQILQIWHQKSQTGNLVFTLIQALFFQLNALNGY